MTDVTKDDIAAEAYEAPRLTDHGLISDLTEASLIVGTFNPDGMTSYTS